MLNYFLNKIRNYWLFKIRYPWVKIGRHVHCKTDAFFWSPNKRITLGNYVGIGVRCIFLCDLEIGNKVLIASDVAFVNSDDHRYDIVGKTIWDSGRGDRYNIVVEEDVWIGHGSIILTPARIGRGSIVAAGSVVNHDVPRYAIVAGVPAQVVKMRFTPEQIVEHEGILAQKGASDRQTHRMSDIRSHLCVLRNKIHPPLR
jgi:acetyltransferase-like isoleucine patch superfamily enzyme